MNAKSDRNGQPGKDPAGPANERPVGDRSGSAHRNGDRVGDPGANKPSGPDDDFGAKGSRGERRPPGANEDRSLLPLELRLRRQLPLLADALAAASTDRPAVAPSAPSPSGSSPRSTSDTTSKVNQGTAGDRPEKPPSHGAESPSGDRPVIVDTAAAGGRSRLVAAAAGVLVLGGLGMALALTTADDSGLLETIDRADEERPDDPSEPDDGDGDRVADAGDVDDQAPTGFGTWRSMADAPIPSRSHAAAYWDGDEAVFWAGTDLERSNASTDGAAYDPISDTWRTVRSPGWGHPGLSAAAVGDRLLVTAKGGATSVDLATGESIEVAKPGDSTVDGKLLYTGAVAADPAPDPVAGDQPDGYLIGGLSRGAGMAGLVVVGYDAETGRTWTVHEDPAASMAWDGQPFPAVEPLWTGDEVVVWSGDGTGYAVDPARGEAMRLPALRTGLGHVADSRLVMTDLGPMAVARLDDSGTSTVRLARLVGRDWAWSQSMLAVQDFATASIVGAGEWVVMVSADEPPLAWHVPSGRWFRDQAGPAVAGTNLVWTGERVVAWGGTVSPGSGDGVAMTWTPPPARSEAGDGSDIPPLAGGSSRAESALFDLRFDSGDRFRLALPPRFSGERFDIVQQPGEGRSAVATSRSLRVTIDYEDCGEVTGAANALGSEVKLHGRSLTLCREDSQLSATIDWLSGSQRPSGDEVEVENFDLRPLALGSAYRDVLAGTWPELADCARCHPPTGPYLGDGDVIITVNGSTTVEALHPVGLEPLWSFAPGGPGTTLHHLSDGVGVAAEGGDFLNLDSWLGTIQWSMKRDPDERSTMVSNHGSDRAGFGLMRTSFDIEGDDRGPLLRRFHRSLGRVSWTAQGPEGSTWLRLQPAVTDDVIVVVAATGSTGDETATSSLLAFDRESGQQRWSTELGEVTPRTISVDGSGQAEFILVETDSATPIVVDAESGGRLRDR